MRDNFSRMVSLNGSGWLRSTHSNKQLSAIAIPPAQRIFRKARSVIRREGPASAAFTSLANGYAGLAGSQSSIGFPSGSCSLANRP